MTRIRYNSTGKEERGTKVQELEAQIGKLMQKNKRLKHELRGYRNFTMPINITCDDLTDKVIDGNVKKYLNFARHAVIKSFREKDNLGAALNQLYKSLREAIPGSHWAMIFYPASRSF